MSKDLAIQYFRGVGEALRSESNRSERAAFVAALHTDPEYKTARNALRDPSINAVSYALGEQTRSATSICARVSEGEKEKIVGISARVGIDVSTYMRFAGLRLADEIIAASGGFEALRTWYEEREGLRRQVIGDQPDKIDGRKSGKSRKSREVVERAIREYANSQEEPPTRQEIAAALGFTTSHLNNYIVRMTGLREYPLPDNGKVGKKPKGVRFDTLETATSTNEHIVFDTNKE